MKKNYFLSFVMLLCFMTLAVKANAQAESMVDLYGKWAFTATVETTALAADYEGRFAAESEVVITKDPYGNFEAEISGFAGGTGTFNPYGFYADTQTLFIMNAPNVWGSGLSMSFAEGGYPYATDNFYSELEWAYDDATKTITIPDFTLVGNLDHSAGTAETVAKFTNCKMVQTEAEIIEIPSIAGEYDYEPVEGYVRNDSTFAYTFTLSLVATDETNKAYDATIAFGDFEPFTLPATFDGSMLTIPYNEQYLVDGENKYFFGAASPAAKKDGAFEFKYNSETVLEQWTRIYIRQDSVLTEKEVVNEETGEVTIETVIGYPIVQRLNWGYATRESEETAGFSWAGKYNVSSTVILADEEFAATFGEWPSEFQMVIEEKTPGSFYLTEFMGRNIYNANWGACAINLAEDNKSATLALDQSWGMLLLESLGDGEYLQMFDGMGKLNPITFTLNDDGTITIDPVFIQNTIYDESHPANPVVFYQDMKAVKEVEKFDWASGYFLTADVEVFDTTREWPSEFVAKIEWNEGWGCYLLTEFFNYNNLTSLTYGANSLNVAEDTQSATYEAVGGLIGGAYPLYYNIYDGNEGTTALNFTVNEDGTVSMDDFILFVSNYEGSGAAVKGAKYSNVVLTKGDTTGIGSVVEEVAPVVEGIFDLMGRKYDAITAPGIYIVNGKKVVK
ncbi:MAG: hypothetical protein IJ277_05970 [Bacteroidaceae bacterium]|nr:hypothetical protein [Bacteroidaceae bacterium]